MPRNGSLTFRSRFLDFTGKFVLHCHMMNHEELGMMQIVEVYDRSSSRLEPSYADQTSRRACQESPAECQAQGRLHA